MPTRTSSFTRDVSVMPPDFTALNPLHARLAFWASGLAMPQVETACELGFGTGLGLAIRATASPTQWWGAEFNPSHASQAQEMLDAAGVSARLINEAVMDFCARPNLPEFDFITLHGVWDTLDDASRYAVAELLNRRLKVGGVFYISYSALPGWAPLLPVRQLLQAHQASVGNGSARTLPATLEFARQLLAASPRYSQSYPELSAHLSAVAAQAPEALSQGFLHPDWQPSSFTDMARWLEPAKLNFACPAQTVQLIAHLHLSPAQQSLLDSLPDDDEHLRQATRDILCNTAWRADYWVKGPRQLNPRERDRLLDAQRLALLKPADSIDLLLDGAADDIALNPQAVQPILQALAHHKPMTLEELEQALPQGSHTPAQILEAVLLLSGKGELTLLQDPPAVRQSKPATAKLNHYIMNQSRTSADFGWLASPASGSAVPVNRIEQLFLLAASEGSQHPREWAQFAWMQLQSLGQRLAKDGQVIADEQENLNELLNQATHFNTQRLPILRTLQVAP